MIAALDNGSTGSLAVIWDKGLAELWLMSDGYTKVERSGRTSTTRLDFEAFSLLVADLKARADKIGEEAFCFMEKPLTRAQGMSGRALMSAARFYEAELIAMEKSGIGFMVISSDKWQKGELPGVSGRHELKKASMEKGLRLFPKLADKIRKQKDADALLMAFHFWARGRS